MGLTGKERERADYIMDQLNLIGMFYYAANQFFEDFFEGKKFNAELLQRVILNPDDFQTQQ